MRLSKRMIKDFMTHVKVEHIRSEMEKIRYEKQLLRIHETDVNERARVEKLKRTAKAWAERLRAIIAYLETVEGEDNIDSDESEDIDEGQGIVMALKIRD